MRTNDTINDLNPPNTCHFMEVPWLIHKIFPKNNKRFPGSATVINTLVIIYTTLLQNPFKKVITFTLRELTK